MSLFGTWSQITVGMRKARQEKEDKAIRSVKMSHYHCVPLALSPSGDHLSNPVKCSSELSC